MTINVGVIGAGTVGGGVIELLARNQDTISTAAGITVRLSHICEINPDNLSGLDTAGAKVTGDVKEVLASGDVHIVCELIGGVEPARRFILDALGAGKNVVTANKMLLACHGKELAEAAVANNVDLRYEAAVAGGIPIIKALREGLAANRVRAVYGILNGTCNYILSRMTYDGLEFDAVLERAQEMGFAETPPDLDIEGHDTAHKCQIIASLCYASEVNIDNIPVEGITSITRLDVMDALELGYLIKLLAVVREVDGEIDARVHPTLIPEDHLLASVRDEFNAVYVDADATGPTLYYGRGAGRQATASAVVADIVDVARRGSGAPSPPFRYNEHRPLRPIGKLYGRFFLRLTTEDRPGVLGAVGTLLGNHGVSIASFSQKDPHGENRVHLVILTHDTLESDLRGALAEIDALKVILEPTHVLRILNDSPANGT